MGTGSGCCCAPSPTAERRWPGSRRSLIPSMSSVSPRAPTPSGVTAIACIIGFFVIGVAYLAHHTHVTPYISEYPSMLAEIARTVFGDGVIGHILFLLVQITTAAVLFTGANTSFNGFPALASFVAADRFLPRPLTNGGIGWFSPTASSR